MALRFWADLRCISHAIAVGFWADLRYIGRKIDLTFRAALIEVNSLLICTWWYHHRRIQSIFTQSKNS